MALYIPLGGEVATDGGLEVVYCAAAFLQWIGTVWIQVK